MPDAQPVAAPAEASAGEQEVDFPGDGLTLHGTLERPPEMPAMLLLQGSGPVDRDGNIPEVFETNLEKQVAQALARAGVATLRYDKRSSDKTQIPTDTDAIAAFLDWNNIVGDAVAAWRFLREQPGIDRQRVGIFGHSEGGVLALAAAQQLLDAGEAPAVLVLAATPGRPMGEVVREQIERIMKQKGVDHHDAAKLLNTLDKIQEEVSETGEIPDDVPASLKPLYKPELGAYWQSLLQLDPAELAKLFPGPVLIIEGTADKQVSVREDALTLSDALSERPEDDHDLMISPRVSHELKTVDSPNAAGETGPIKPSLLEGITNWIKEKLLQ
jgi:pimeloyl-ACP methyl ester carboxylesterase